MHLPAVADSLDADGSDFMRSFVEQYLTSRGYSITSRNARVVVAAIARCRPPGLDAPTLEACIDRALDPELLRPAA
ncbi:MAG: hypothetical protein ABI920_16345 [Casimicrobiaceae bacterium]